MNKVTIVNQISKVFRKTSSKAKKHSPEILMVVGITGVVVSTVMACRATTKLDPILVESKDTLNRVKKKSEDNRKEVALVYVQTGAKVAKLYAPSVMLGVLSITSILASNDILKKRNMALAAAYTAVDTGFKEYRSRVVERFGEEVDHELRFNAKARKVEEIVVDENGKEKKVKKTVNVVEINEETDVARYFDNRCKGWERDHGYNMTFLSMQQSYANDKLKALDGQPLFLNDIYDELGIKRSRRGQIVGWRYVKNNPIGDNEVDFGIREVYREVFNEKTGEKDLEMTILLDFNDEGSVLEYL